MSEQKTWSDKRAEIMSRPGAGAAYEAARIRFELGCRTDEIAAPPWWRIGDRNVVPLLDAPGSGGD
ncbi:hypothetical protein [Microtetraspora malaysiensis]|uniref:hypothetical protein n=1 Tax=Microtetraspora malaysiensis TaxID=161358 RepID=UPI003D8CD4C7